jgi:hypothetical protein
VLSWNLAAKEPLLAVELLVFNLVSASAPVKPKVRFPYKCDCVVPVVPTVVVLSPKDNVFWPMTIWLDGEILAALVFAPMKMELFALVIKVEPVLKYPAKSPMAIFLLEEAVVILPKAELPIPTLYDAFVALVKEEFPIETLPIVAVVPLNKAPLPITMLSLAVVKFVEVEKTEFFGSMKAVCR